MHWVGGWGMKLQEKCQREKSWWMFQKHFLLAFKCLSSTQRIVIQTLVSVVAFSFHSPDDKICYSFSCFYILSAAKCVLLLDLMTVQFTIISCMYFTPPGDQFHLEKLTFFRMFFCNIFPSFFSIDFLFFTSLHWIWIFMIALFSHWFFLSLWYIFYIFPSTLFFLWEKETRNYFFFARQPIIFLLFFYFTSSFPSSWINESEVTKQLEGQWTRLD